MSDPRRVHNWQSVWLLVPVAVFVVLRLPLVVHQPGGQDEQVFSVPGYTVSREGIPRVPYLPTRNRDTFYENADKCLMALPPGLFYLQAPFFWLMPAGYPPARMPLLIGGVFSVVLAAIVVRTLGGGWPSAILAASIMSLSRPLMFTSILARPDLLCMLCGWLSLLTMLTMPPNADSKRYLLAGGLCGLGGLFHPFALVFCLQCGIWTLLKQGSLIQKLKRSSVLALSAVTVLSLWLPLIIMFPHELESQFFANVLDRAGPGLASRLVNPIASFKHHAFLVWEFCGSWQTVLFGLGTVVGIGIFFMRHHPERTRFTAVVVSSIYLTATVAGTHPTKGYWVYSTLWVAVVIALGIEALCPIQQDGNTRWSRAKFMAISFVCLVCLVPGSGVKSSLTYWIHWGDPRFHAGNFIHNVLKDFPVDGLYLADSPYVFDIYLSGRETLLCQQRELFWGENPISYRYILAAGEAVQDDWPRQYDSEFRETIGLREMPQDCFVNVYVPNNTEE